MAKSIRLYELAKELGLTNKECLDLCVSLGIGVKSHSSSMEEAQADRVRRKAEREGLIRDEQPAEDKPEKPVKAAKKTTKKAAAEPAPLDGASEPAPAPVVEPVVEVAPPAAEPEPVAASAVEPEPARHIEPVAAELPAPAELVAPEVSSDEPSPVAAETEAAIDAAPRRVVSSGGATPPRRIVPTAPTFATPAPSAEIAAPAAPAARAMPGAGRPPMPGMPPSRTRPPGMAPPRSTSGKPIPPPPGPPVSSSGRAIPPPPGGRRFGAPTGGPGGPGGARPGGGAPRPGGGPGGARPFGAPGGGPGGPGGPGGARPGGGPGGGRPGGRPGGPGDRRGPRRKSRRRRSLEELQPMGTPTYTPNSAPVPDGTTVIERASTPQDIGPKLNRTAADVVRFLMQLGEMVTATQSLSDEMIDLFAAEIGATIRLVDPGEEQEVELQKLLNFDDEEDEETYAAWPERAPVITVMGHVDHGKTKLLDRIRSANVVAGEAGGITQHIGAYSVERGGHRIAFIDTPGHEAFTAMRARGADVTDIVVLVVAADDGVMPQTIEALNHAKAADVPIVVAVNKIDREQADPQRVMSQLSEHGLIPEEWGGDTIFCQVSALQDLGIDELLDNLVVVAEVENLRADPGGRARGTVLESHLDIGRGPVATILVQRGTLKVGDPVVAGAAWGRVRALIDDHGNSVKEAGPSTPVQVLGLQDVASAGDDLVVSPTEKIASRVAATREHWQRLANLGRDSHALAGGAKLEDVFKQIQAGVAATLNLILKADVNGSLEAVTESLRKLERDDVKLAFVHRAVGGITESDIQLASTSNATILGFNVRPDRKARELADTERVEIRTYEIIYKLLEDIEAAMLGMLAPEFEEVVTGDAEVRDIFSVPRVGKIAGCYVLNGTITRGSKVRFLREGTIIWKGEVSSLKRFKEDAREVNAGFECGIGLSDFQDLKPGDIIETFTEREIART